MKHKIIPAVIAALILSVWEVPLPFAEILFSIGLILGVLSVLMDFMFFNVIEASTRTKAIHFFRKFTQDARAQHLRSGLRTSVVLAIPAFYVQASIIFIYGFLAYISVCLTYLIYLGRTYEEDLSDPKDFIDGE